MRGTHGNGMLLCSWTFSARASMLELQFAPSSSSLSLAVFCLHHDCHPSKVATWNVCMAPSSTADAIFHGLAARGAYLAMIRLQPASACHSRTRCQQQSYTALHWLTNILHCRSLANILHCRSLTNSLHPCSLINILHCRSLISILHCRSLTTMKG
jgi:hypothetical protein